LPKYKSPNSKHVAILVDLVQNQNANELVETNK
jgi:hypothetical protein